MKKILYSLLFIFTVIFTACEEDLPKASFDLYELKSLTATAGDMNVTLSWEAYENARPNEYLILWTSGSSDAEGGEMTVDAKTMTATINNLVNDVAYTFSVHLVMREDWPVKLLLPVHRRMQDIRFLI